MRLSSPPGIGRALFSSLSLFLFLSLLFSLYHLESVVSFLTLSRPSFFSSFFFHSLHSTSLSLSLSLSLSTRFEQGYMYILAASDRTSRTKTLPKKSVIEKVVRFLIRMIKVREMDLSRRADSPGPRRRLFFHRRRAGRATSRNRYSRCAIGQETSNVCRRCAFPRWKCYASFSRRRGGGTPSLVSFLRSFSKKETTLIRI